MKTIVVVFDNHKFPYVEYDEDKIEEIQSHLPDNWTAYLEVQIEVRPGRLRSPIVHDRVQQPKKKRTPTKIRLDENWWCYNDEGLDPDHHQPTAKIIHTDNAC
jgi:hypothetical protein